MTGDVYRLIRVGGSDRDEFLQGQLTQDMKRLGQLGTLPAALCNPKGRVITTMRIVTLDGGYGLVVPPSMAEAVCARLKTYRLRAKVELEVAGPDWACRVLREERDLEHLARLELKPARALNASRIAHGVTAVNVGIEEPCIELFAFKSDFKRTGIDESIGASQDFLRGARIRAGIPEIAAGQAETYTPHMLNLDLLGAISFDKGCYTGQEIIARTKFLGSSRRRLMRYRSDTELTPGDELSHGHSHVGEILNVCGKDLLAVTAIESHSDKLRCGTQVLTPVPMAYTIPKS